MKPRNLATIAEKAPSLHRKPCYTFQPKYLFHA